MKHMQSFFVVLSLLLTNNTILAQDFNNRFFYEQIEGYHEPKTGVIRNVSDSLAEIRFTGPMMGDNYSFPCYFQFSNDTLYMVQLDADTDLNRTIEYTQTEFMNKKPDSIYLGYQVDYYDGGNPIYKDLFFEVNSVKTANTKQCDSYCALIKRPDSTDFTVKIFTGTFLLDQFDVHLPATANVIRMSKDILSGGGWRDVDKFIGKIPRVIPINGKPYVLVTYLNNYSFDFTHDGKIILHKESPDQKVSK